MRFFVITCGVLLLTVGCQTTSSRSYQQVQLPTTFSQYFDACLQGDGAVHMQLFENDSLVGGADLEWIVDESRGWRAEVVSAVGQPLLRLGYVSGGAIITKSGQLAERLPDFAVDKLGFLQVGGQFVPIRAQEVPCFLKFRYPSRWLDVVTEYQLFEQSARLQMRESHRSVAMNAAGFANAGADSKICSEVSWSRWWGFFHAKLSICQSYAKPRVGTLRGVDKFALRWSAIDE